MDDKDNDDEVYLKRTIYVGITAPSLKAALNAEKLSALDDAHI